MGDGMAAEQGRGRLARSLTPLALFALAFAVRCLPFANVFRRDGIVFVDPDAWYHMRRIAFTAAHFPRSLSVDPYINHPSGGQPIWTPLFDWSVAALLLPFRRGDDVAALERIAVFVPPLLGAATVVALYMLAQRHFGSRVATLAGLILALLSGHFWYSQLGFLDHHAAEALLATLTLAAAMTLLARASAPEVSAAALRRSALATGIAFAASLLLWPGMLLHLALVEAGLVAFALTRREAGAAAAFAAQLARLHLVALAIVAPFALEARWTAWGAYSPVVLSCFQPWLLGAAAAWAAACAAAWRFEAAGRTPARRLASALGIALALLGASALAFPALRDAAGEAWAWFAGADAFQRSVGESLPLLADGSGHSLRVAFARLSAFFLLLPVALCAGVVRAWRTPRPAPQLLCFGWTAGLVAATLVQRRFFNAAAVGVALLFALALVESQRALLRRFPRARLPALAALSLIALALLFPTLRGYRTDAQNVWRGLRGLAPRDTASVLERELQAELADALRARTPEPSDWLDAKARPAYGVLAPWELGHVLEYRARRPTVTDNFGNDIGSENYEAALRAFRSDEASAAALLDALSVRYVVTQRDTAFLGAEPSPASLAVSAFRRDGALAAAPAEAPALERLRLVYESGPLYFTQHPQEPRYKVFELVRGARIEGQSAPGARIRARLGLRSNRGRPFVYVAEAVAGPDGRYALRVPHATQDGPAALQADPFYRLACGDDEQTLRVEESAVVGGALVEGPRLCAGS